MSGCTQSDKPLITIVMAVYHPPVQWLIELLDSLNAQTYPNLELIICDDGPDKPVDAGIFGAHITAFGWTLVQNEQNLGSNKTFERLTAMARGAYIAYCDQDDVWLPEKLERLQTALAEDSAVMSYCDMAVIDAAGKPVADSLRAVRPRLHYVSGPHLAEVYFFRNCTAGCSMLITAQTAQAACPFPRLTVCDQWLALLAAQQGAVAFVDTPLMRYRVHGNNQTGILNGVFSKTDYREKRLLPLRERLDLFKRYGSPSPALCDFVTARLSGNRLGIWKNRKLSETEARFELAMHGMPEPLFRWILRKVK